MNLQIISIILAVLALTGFIGAFKYFPISGSVKQFPRETVAKSCHLGVIRGDTCFKNEYKPCNTGSYEQCTNNFMPVNKCSCKEQRSFELCLSDLQMSECCYMKHYNLQPDLKVDVKHEKKYPRVNIHNIPYTPFDRFEHLRSPEDGTRTTDDSTVKDKITTPPYFLPNPLPIDVAAADIITRIPIELKA